MVAPLIYIYMYIFTPTVVQSLQHYTTLPLLISAEIDKYIIYFYIDWLHQQSIIYMATIRGRYFAANITLISQQHYIYTIIDKHKSNFQSTAGFFLGPGKAHWIHYFAY